MKGTHLIIGDVHSMYNPFADAVRFANTNKLHLVTAGDLIDNGPDGYAVTELMLQEMFEGRASGVMGNHEWKIIRWLRGNDVKLTNPNFPTVEAMEKQPAFKDMFARYAKRLSFNLQVGENMFVAHAAVKPEWWADRKEGRKTNEYNMYGNSDSSKLIDFRGERYPIRLYNWVDHVPENVKLFVGHDPRPMIGEPDFDNFQATPLSVKNKQGGITTFLDAGSGKGGNLWGAVVNSANNSIEALINFGQ